MKGKMTLACQCALALLLAADVLAAQQTIKLRVTETIPVPGVWVGPIMVPVKCDAKRNIYYRGYQRGNPMAAPVVKISAEGKHGPVFALDSVPGFEGGPFKDFAVSLRGGVYLLAGREKEQVIVSFDEDGKYISTIKLESRFAPAQIASFPSGEFLVTGMELRLAKEGVPSGEPFTAIFDGRGELTKRLDLPDDVKPAARPKEGEDPNPAISLGMAMPGDDGNIYSMRFASPPVVHVISPGGEVLRRMAIAPPAGNFRAITMKVAGGKLVVQFEENDPATDIAQRVFSLLDAETGEKILDYEPAPEVGGAFACYTPNGFTFLAHQGRQLVIQRVVPR